MRLLAISSLIACVALAGGVLSSSAAPRLAPPRAVASADAYVTAAAKKRNFGRARVLHVGIRPASRAYLRFDLKGIAGATVTKATLRLHAVSSLRRCAPRGGAALSARRCPWASVTVRRTSARWSERGVTFRNAPRAGARIASSGPVGRGLVTVDITRIVRGVSTGKPLNLALTAPSGLVRVASREGARAPRIDFVLESSTTLIAAGDIAYCGQPWDEATAALVEQRPPGPVTVAALGDLAYEEGSLDQFNSCYQPSWGRFKERTRPAPGNHEYLTPGASGYFSYWGAAAGNPAQGWYSYDLGKWHVVSLNSNCSFVGGCGAGSPQETWLRADLAAHPTMCTVAYWHHPRFSGGQVTNAVEMEPFWQALYDANADLVLVGHAHNYQRFAPQNASGIADPARGLRQFVVGTGGHPTLHPVAPIANTEVVNNTTWGVLDLKLWPTRYDWQFLPVAGQTFTDSGTQACH